MLVRVRDEIVTQDKGSVVSRRQSCLLTSNQISGTVARYLKHHTRGQANARSGERRHVPRTLSSADDCFGPCALAAGLRPPAGSPRWSPRHSSLGRLIPSTAPPNYLRPSSHTRTLHFPATRRPPALPHPSSTRRAPPVDFMTTDIQNLKSFDPFAEADDAGGEVKSTQQNYIHIRIQRTYALYLLNLTFSCVRHRRAVPSPLSSCFRKSRKADVNPQQSVMVVRL